MLSTGSDARRLNAAVGAAAGGAAGAGGGQPQRHLLAFQWTRGISEGYPPQPDTRHLEVRAAGRGSPFGTVIRLCLKLAPQHIGNGLSVGNTGGNEYLIVNYS